ncbi:MAG TPA: PilW family protein [Woeseiaceae bacterium]|nr:PilW family protein [Woeseiaceae bacterium]
MHVFTNDRASRRQTGVTLVELMVSLVLALLLTAGIIKVFSGNHVTYEFNQSLSRIQENARFALDHIAYDARMAGYKGCISNVKVYNNLNAPNNFRDDLQNGIQGFDANGTSDGDSYGATATNPAPSSDVNAWTPALPPELTDKVIPGSDVLVVRGVSGAGVSLASPFTNAAQIFVSPDHDFAEGEILVVSDCQKASIFQVTSVNAIPNHNIVHSKDSTQTPGNAIADWPPEQAYGLGAEAGRLQTQAFYVGQGANGAPALFQLRLARQSAKQSSFQPEELVENIETLQVRYGLDTDADEAIDNWVTADAVTDWLNVLSVELTLLARAPEEYGTDVDDVDYTLGATTFNPVDDRRLRQVFSTTISVRNRLP